MVNGISTSRNTKILEMIFATTRAIGRAIEVTEGAKVHQDRLRVRISLLGGVVVLRIVYSDTSTAHNRHSTRAY
jgi:hypothetical protein